MTRGVGDGFGPAVFLPLQLPNDVRGVGGFKAAAREAKTLANEFELGGEHLLFLDELPQNVVVLAIAGDVGDDAEVVSGEGSVAKLFETGTTADEHVVEPRGEGDRDEATHGRGIDGFGIGTLSRLFATRETVNVGGVPGVETNEAGSNQVAVLADVEARDEVVVADVALRRGVPTFSDLSQIFFEVGDDVFESGDLRGMLRGAGLDREGKAVNELSELLGGDVGVSVEGSKH